MSYYKYISETEVQQAPKNFNGISNFDQSIELLTQYGYKPMEEDPYPSDGNQYSAYFEQLDDKIVKHWKLIPVDLEALKAEKLQYIEQQKQLAQDIGVLYNGYHYQMDADGKANILGIRVAIVDGSYTTFPIQFKTYENEYVELTKDQYLEMSNAALDFVYKCLQQKEILSQQVNAATSEEDLDKIVWVFE